MEAQGTKWTTLAHNGVMFPPPYARLPGDVRLLYDGQPMELDEESEEAATLYARHILTNTRAQNPVGSDIII
jgi:DNA topoisomerase I